MTGNESYTDESSDEPLSQTVICAVAAANDVDPLDLDDRLYDCIDPDALDKLFEPTASGLGGSVQFTMSGCHVTAYDDGTVAVDQIRESTTKVEAHV